MNKIHPGAYIQMTRRIYRNDIAIQKNLILQISHADHYVKFFKTHSDYKIIINDKEVWLHSYEIRPLTQREVNYYACPLQVLQSFIAYSRNPNFGKFALQKNYISGDIILCYNFLQNVKSGSTSIPSIKQTTEEYYLIFEEEGIEYIIPYEYVFPTDELNYLVEQLSKVGI